MNSIVKQQLAQNHHGLGGTDAIKKIQKLATRAQSCFFYINIHGGAFGTRPMAVFTLDDRGHFGFLSFSDRDKNAKIQLDPAVFLLQGSGHSDFLNIVGTATVSTNWAELKELWNPALRTWFMGGEDDPRLTAIEVTPQQGYYWGNKHDNAVQDVEIAIGALVARPWTTRLRARFGPRCPDKTLPLTWSPGSPHRTSYGGYRSS